MLPMPIATPEQPRWWKYNKNQLFFNDFQSDLDAPGALLGRALGVPKGALGFPGASEARPRKVPGEFLGGPEAPNEASVGPQGSLGCPPER